MAVSKGSKGKFGASKGGTAKSKPSETKGKKAGTRVSTLGDLRSAGSKKSAGGGSRNKPRDGS